MEETRFGVGDWVVAELTSERNMACGGTLKVVSKALNSEEICNDFINKQGEDGKKYVVLGVGNMSKVTIKPVRELTPV